jgi:hypothetical protein
MMARMRLFLLTIALMLMVAALTSPFWVGRSERVLEPSSPRQRITGRIKGDFPDRPWAGTTVNFGQQKAALTEDGTFSFVSPPGLYILKVCCSDRFDRIYKEILVEDRDLYFEVEAMPLRQISGRVVTPSGKPLRYTLQISAWLVGTNTVDRTIVSSDGAFVLRLSEGEWRVDLDNLRPAHTLQLISLDGVKVRERMLKIPTAHGPPLPLQITLK